MGIWKKSYAVPEPKVKIKATKTIETVEKVDLMPPVVSEVKVSKKKSR